MKNKIVYILISFCWASNVFAFDNKIVFLDLDKAFDGYYKTKLADAQLKDQSEIFTADRKEMIEEYQGLQTSFNETHTETSNQLLSDEVREEKRNEAAEMLTKLREQEGKIRNFDETRRKQLEEQGRRMRKRIVAEIQEHVKTFAKKQGYSAVIDTSGQSLNGVPIVLFFDPRVDITTDVLDLLNKGKDQ